MRKQVQERKALLREVGLHLKRIEHRSKHIAYVCDEGTLFSSTTPSDSREWRNFRSRARRMRHHH